MKRRGFFAALIGAPPVCAAGAVSQPISVHPSTLRDVERYRATKEDVDGLLESLRQLREQCEKPFVVNMQIGGKTSEVGRLELSKP